jgi:hypothetical protein
MCRSMEIQFWDVKKLGMLDKKLDCPMTLLDFQIYIEINLKLLHQYGVLRNDLVIIILRRILRLDHGMSTILLNIDLYC